MVSALLAAAASRAELETPVTLQDVGVCLDGKALPKGLITRKEAVLIMRAVSLAQSPSVPEPLPAESGMDAEGFVMQKS